MNNLLHKMIDYSKGNIKDIEHLLKVNAYSLLIGREEGLDKETLEILDIASIVHDIACPLCREKYGRASGHYQEIESEALLREFFKDEDIKKEYLERVIYLVSHHHTYENVKGIDYQILLEADYLVNASEKKDSKNTIEAFKQRVFKTKTGIELLESIFQNVE